MRTLKYRAYIRPLKRYAEKYETILYHHQCNMEPTWTVNISPEEYYGDEELVIEQFTGLLDRNGIEIYEGDIVQTNYMNAKGWVVWTDGAWGICLSGDSFELFLAEEVGVGCEVIGNIHEPPKDFRPEHLKRMGVSISKGGEG